MKEFRGMFKFVGFGLLGLIVLSLLTPVFYLVGYVTEYLLVSGFDFVCLVFVALAQIVSYLLMGCKSFIATFLPSLPDCLSGGEGDKTFVGFVVSVYVLALMRLRFSKGGDDE